MFTKRDFQFFEIAKNIARLSTFPKVKIGSVVVKDGNIISTGVNSTKTHPMQSFYNKFRGFESKNRIHAEMSAIAKIKNKKELIGASIYVNRICGNRENGLCKPCPACMKALMEHKIKSIFYTTDTGFAEEIVLY